MELMRKLYYVITGMETKWDCIWDGKQYNWKKLRLPIKRGEMMKKLFGLVIIAVLLPSMVYATPFLVCDPYPSTGTQPTYFMVSIDGGTAVQSPAYTVTGGVIVHHDVGNVSVGVHTWTVSACVPLDEWGGGGCSTTAPFSSTRHSPGGNLSPPTGMHLSAQ